MRFHLDYIEGRYRQDDLPVRQRLRDEDVSRFILYWLQGRNAPFIARQFISPPAVGHPAGRRFTYHNVYAHAARLAGQGCIPAEYGRAQPVFGDEALTINTARGMGRHPYAPAAALPPALRPQRPGRPPAHLRPTGGRIERSPLQGADALTITFTERHPAPDASTASTTEEGKDHGARQEQAERAQAGNAGQSGEQRRAAGGEEPQEQARAGVAPDSGAAGGEPGAAPGEPDQAGSGGQGAAHQADGAAQADADPAKQGRAGGRSARLQPRRPRSIHAAGEGTVRRKPRKA